MSDWPPPNCQSSTGAEPTMPCVGAGLYDAPGAARIYDPCAMYRGRFKERSGHRVTNEIIGWWEDGSSCFGSNVGIPEFEPHFSGQRCSLG